MKLKKDKFREYKIVKIVKNDKFYYRPMFRDDTYLNSKEWNNLGVLITDTDILAPAEYRHKFSAMRRIVQDKIIIKGLYNKFEIFEEIPVGKIKIK
jgi:hypothetical protein